MLHIENAVEHLQAIYPVCSLVEVFAFCDHFICCHAVDLKRMGVQQTGRGRVFFRPVFLWVEGIWITIYFVYLHLIFVFILIYNFKIKLKKKKLHKIMHKYIKINRSL